MYTVSQKKENTRILRITLTNLDLFFNFGVHYHDNSGKRKTAKYSTNTNMLPTGDDVNVTSRKMPFIQDMHRAKAM